MILVTGATGNVGRQVVAELLGAGADVRALAREPDAAGLPAGVEIMRGDLSAPATLEAALRDVESVFLIWPFLTTEGAPAIIAAIAAHARRLVYLSSMSVRDDLDQQTDPISAFHAELERLIKNSGLQWTLLRSGGMATNTLMWAPQIRDGGIVRWPFGAAARSLIHERDIAAVAALALSDGDGHDRATHVLTGPRTLTQVEQVQTIGEALGRGLRFEEISREAARADLLAAWGDASLVDGALDAWAQMVTEPEPITQTVHELTGTPARSFGQWAADHAADFR